MGRTRPHRVAKSLACPTGRVKCCVLFVGRTGPNKGTRDDTGRDVPDESNPVPCNHKKACHAGFSLPNQTVVPACMLWAGDTHGKNSMTNFQVIVEPGDGQFVTYVPALDFASTFGPTREAALDRTRKMIAGYIEASAKEGIVIDVPAAGQRAELVDLAISA